jgi:c-di-GMP-related signal transduction protein
LERLLFKDPSLSFRLLIQQPLNNKAILSHYKQSLQRVLFCQFLANFIPEILTDITFTSGLFLNLDAYFDIPLTELIEKVDLQEDMKEALTKRTGETGFYVYNCH